MKVIVINEESHGDIAIAANYKKAVEFLLNNDWISDYSDICTFDTNKNDWCWKTVREVFGEDWAKIMRDQWDINKFNEAWEDGFTLTEEEVYGAD